MTNREKWVTLALSRSLRDTRSGRNPVQAGGGPAAGVSPGLPVTALPLRSRSSGRVEAFCEPAVDGPETIARLILPLLGAYPSEADRGAPLEPAAARLSCDRQCAAKTCLDLDPVGGRQPTQQIASQTMKFRIGPVCRKPKLQSSGLASPRAKAADAATAPAPRSRSTSMNGNCLQPAVLPPSPDKPVCVGPNFAPPCGAAEDSCLPR